MDTIPTQHSHTQLYIVVGLLVLFAILFFTFKIGDRAIPIPQIKDSTPLQLKRIILTAEEIAQKEAALKDPALTTRVTLSKEEIAAKKKLLDDPALTARATN